MRAAGYRAAVDDATSAWRTWTATRALPRVRVNGTDSAAAVLQAVRIRTLSAIDDITIRAPDPRQPQAREAAGGRQRRRPDQGVVARGAASTPSGST